MPEAEKQSQFAKALMELRELLMSGAVAPGARLSEVAVSQRLGISRTPLRAAMSRLVDEGFLDRIPTGGCRVRQVTVADVQDAIELRGTLEGLAVRLAAERGAQAADLDACRDLMDRIDGALGPDADSIDFEAFAALNDAFHDAMCGLCRSDTVLREIARAKQLPLAAPGAFLLSQTGLPYVRRSLFMAQAQHRGIVEAVAAREGARAEALAREHARLAARNLDYLVQQDVDEVRDVPGLAMVMTG
ncbi:MAG: GntR family transcriptional regulator [Tranquillimonas sp.]